MAKSKFTDVELKQIRSIQERLGCSCKTAVKKFRQSQTAGKADAKKAAANDKPEAASPSTMTNEQRTKIRAEGVRMFVLAGRPSKEDFIKVYGERGPKMTWWSARRRACQRRISRRHLRRLANVGETVRPRFRCGDSGCSGSSQGIRG